MPETNPQTPKKPQRKPRQARSPKGTFETGVEPTPVEQALPKKDYSVKPKVTPAGNGGKYSQKPKVRPTFGKVYSTTN